MIFIDRLEPPCAGSPESPLGGYRLARVTSLAGDDSAAQARQLFLLAFNREPNHEERNGATAVIREHGLAALCRAVLNANEFVFAP